MSKMQISQAELHFYCGLCNKPKKLKQMSKATLSGKPLCKKCAKPKSGGMNSLFSI